MLKRSPGPARRCPFPTCPSHTRPRSKGIVRHGYLRSRHGSRLRLLCRTCGRTFCNRRGSAYYRLQHPRKQFDSFAALLAEGLSSAALARALSVAPATITRWLGRAAAHARSFADEHDRVERPFELQFDEISGRPASEPRSPWIYNGIEVSSRYWVAAFVGRRSRRSTRAFVLQARAALGSLASDLLVVSDPFPYYERELERSMGPRCVYVKVRNSYLADRVVHTQATLVLGTPDRLDAIFERSEDSNRPNTAYVERLNLFLRRSCSYLHRRTSGKVRNPRRLSDMVEVIRCGYNFVRPHSALRPGGEPTTPAMQAGVFASPLSWRSIFEWPRPAPNPAQLLARLVRPPGVR